MGHEVKGQIAVQSKIRRDQSKGPGRDLARAPYRPDGKGVSVSLLSGGAFSQEGRLVQP